MDLSEKWPLEDGTWLPHAGIHHFANTRGDSEFGEAPLALYSPEELGRGAAFPLVPVPPSASGCLGIEHFILLDPSLFAVYWLLTKKKSIIVAHVAGPPEKLDRLLL
ncbi:Sh2 Domain-Containing Adapter Protein F [Manis pentadactyla]|nr:Sh2 Domain-Containing Adapter Protein F [Manis pentadactyla]